MIEGRTALIVDELSDTREVLRTVLESRGMRIVEAARKEQGLELAQRHQPDVVIWDLESGAGARPGDGQTPLEEREWTQVPTVFLGRATISQKPPSRGAERKGCYYLPKPFHFVELIRTIETVLRQQESRQIAERPD
ncbi:MAG: response regulator [Planctomycetes bacterium]|nr:response regulator [Planctomycetota bacterium]